MGKLSQAAGSSATATPPASSDTASVTFDEALPDTEVVDFSDSDTLLTLSTYEQVVAQLEADLDRARVKQREGYRGSMLDYLEWTTTVRQLNSIFGYGHWSTEVTNITDLALDDDGIPMGARATVKLRVYFPNEKGVYDHYEMPEATYENVGFSTTRANRDGKRTWDAYDMAVKGAVSDALKRCAVNLGNQFGLSLYEKGVATASATPTAQTGSAARPAATGVYTSQTAGGDEPACEACGKTIAGYTSKSGKTYTTEQLVNYSTRDCDGHVFCYEHKQAWLNSHR